jgi:predicted GIY-YIG superfamily endonuclease
LPDNTPLPDELFAALRVANETTRTFALNCLQPILTEARERRERETAIKERWLKMSFDALIKEANDKLFAYRRRAEEGEDMRLAIQQEEENLKSLIRKQNERLEELEKERQLMPMEPQLEAVALIIPKTLVAKPTDEDEEAKRLVEEAGMKVAMEYERTKGRNPEDVSNQFLGYDILSRSETEVRYIEVKAFATTGTVELTPHEWQMAERLQDAYWLYIVEDALTEPKLYTVQNPAASLKAQPVTGVIKIVVDGWKQVKQE